MTQLDLLEWAANRPTAQIIDRQEFFRDKIVLFLRLELDGWKPPNYEPRVIPMERRVA